MSLAAAVAEVVVAAGRADGAARLNLLATDGSQLVATTWGETLSYRVSMDGDDIGMDVASEPSDDSNEWVDLDDHQLLTTDTRDVTISNLI